MTESKHPTLRTIEADYWTLLFVLEFLQSGLCPSDDELIGRRKAKDQLQLALQEGKLKDVVLKELGHVDQNTGRRTGPVGRTIYDSTILRDILGDGIVEDSSSVICWDGERERYYHVLIGRKAVEELWNMGAKHPDSGDAPEPAYRSPFVSLMLEAEKHFADQLAQVGMKKGIENWLDERGKQIDQDRWSKAKKKMMATFLRHPAMQKGGATKTPGNK